MEKQANTSVAREGFVLGRLLELVRQTGIGEQAEAQVEKGDIMSEISTILNRLETVEAALSFETDEDLIDAGIYEIKSLNCRYTYYLKQAKKLGISGV